MRGTETSIDRNTLHRGGTDLLYVSLIARPAVDWPDRARLARTMTQALHEAGISAAHAHAGPEGLVVTCTGRARLPDIDDLTRSLTAWRSRLGTTPVCAARPPTSPAELITALTFDGIACRREPSEDRHLSALLRTMHFDVVVSGGRDADDLRRARVAICRALDTAAVEQSGVADARTPAAPDPTVSRRWARVPMRSSWIRWYRFLSPPADESEQLARSLANVAFGGVHGSLLVDLVRRQRGLSYSPQSTLLRRDGLHLLVIDVQTTAGDEDLCDAAIKTALEQFSSTRLSDDRVRAAARYLVGRTLVDRDSMQGAADERAAVFEGSLSSALDSSWTADDLCVAAGASLSPQIHDLYRPTEFSALVMSPNPGTGKWVEL